MFWKAQFFYLSSMARILQDLKLKIFSKNKMKSCARKSIVLVISQFLFLECIHIFWKFFSSFGHLNFLRVLSSDLSIYLFTFWKVQAGKKYNVTWKPDWLEELHAMILSKNAFSSTTVKYRLGLTFRSKIDIFSFLQKNFSLFY